MIFHTVQVSQQSGEVQRLEQLLAERDQEVKKKYVFY